MRFAATVLYVNDVPAAMDFYKRVFGLSVRFYDEALGFVEFEAGSSTLALASHSLGDMLMPGAYHRSANGEPEGVEIAWLTNNVPELFAKVIAGGATAVALPRRMPWGLEVAYVKAPDGTIIGLSEPPPSTVV